MNLEQLGTALTDTLRSGDEARAADLIVEARTNHFIDQKGNADLPGRSYAYRQWFGQALDQLNLSAEDRSKLTGRLRFRVGNGLRRVASAEELKDAGLLAVSPIQRGKRNYENRSAPYRAVRGTGRLDDEDVAGVCEVLSGLTDRVEKSALSSTQRKRLMREIDKLRRAAQG